MPYSNIPDDKIEAMDACVAKVEAQGDVDNPYAVCFASVVEGKELDTAIKEHHEYKDMLKRSAEISAEVDRRLAEKSLANNVGNLLQGSIHRAYTIASDELLLRGYLMHAERMAIGKLVGDLLKAMADQLDPNMFQRLVAPSDVDWVASKELQVTQKMTLADPVLEEVRKQITRERYAEAAYMSLASWADGQGFEGLTRWADGEARSEREHAQIFLSYLRDRGWATLETVPAPPSEWGTYERALDAALGLEKAVSLAIGTLYRDSMEAGDGATARLAEKMLKGQVESEKELETLLLRVRRGAPIDLLDLELFQEV